MAEDLDAIRDALDFILTPLMVTTYSTVGGQHTFRLKTMYFRIPIGQHVETPKDGAEDLRVAYLH